MRSYDCEYYKENGEWIHCADVEATQVRRTLRRFGLALMIVQLKRLKDEEIKLRRITFGLR
jgi:hypothetical protein